MHMKLILALGLTLLAAACSSTKSPSGSDGTSNSNRLVYSANQIADGQVEKDLSITVSACEEVDADNAYEKAADIDWVTLKDKGISILLLCNKFEPGYYSPLVIVEVDINSRASDIQAFLNNQPVYSNFTQIFADQNTYENTVFHKVMSIKTEIETKSGYVISDAYFIFKTKSYLDFLQRLASLKWEDLKGRDFKQIAITTVLDENRNVFESSSLSTQYSPYTENPYITIDPRMTNTEIFNALGNQLSANSRTSKQRAKSHNLMLRLMEKGVLVSCENPQGIEACLSEFELLDRSDLTVMPAHGNIFVTPGGQTTCEVDDFISIQIHCNISSDSNKQELEAALKKALKN